MNDIGLKEIHIGRAIKDVFDASKMSKSEFGRLIGVQQQHINRIFERDAIDTKKLALISLALKHNFFGDYCEASPHIYANQSYVANGNGASVYGSACASDLIIKAKVLEATYEGAMNTEKELREQIELLKETNKMLRESNEELKTRNQA